MRVANGVMQTIIVKIFYTMVLLRFLVVLSIVVMDNVTIVFKMVAVVQVAIFHVKEISPLMLD